jgi:hypothetical protein
MQECKIAFPKLKIKVVETENETGTRHVLFAVRKSTKKKARSFHERKSHR